MSKKLISKSRKKKIYWQALAVLAVYFAFSNTVFVHFAFLDNRVISYGVPMVVGAVAGVIFLYIFSHEDFFSFAKDLEKREMKAEKKWLKHFVHFGKLSTTFAVGTVGGPILAALTIRLLLSASRYRYVWVILANIPSTIFSVGIAKGAISIFS